jgi:hypothetical protein
MYVRKSFKKRKYLIVKLFSMSASKRSLYLYRYRCSGCINIWDIPITTYVIVWLAFHQTDVHYEVAIDTVSGDLSFNLTLGVGSRSYVAKVCIQPECPTRMWRLPTAAPGSPRVRPRWGGTVPCRGRRLSGASSRGWLLCLRLRGTYSTTSPLT